MPGWRVQPARNEQKKAITIALLSTVLIAGTAGLAAANVGTARSLVDIASLIFTLVPTSLSSSILLQGVIAPRRDYTQP